MIDQATSFNKVLQNIWNGGLYLSNWICKPVSTLFTFLPLRSPVGYSDPLSSSMDIIEIESSDSDDDFENSNAGLQGSSFSEAANRNYEFDTNDRSRHRVLPSSFNMADRVQRQPPLTIRENNLPKAPTDFRSIRGFHSKSSFPRTSAGVVQIFPPTSSSNGNIGGDSMTKASNEMRFNNNFHAKPSNLVGANYDDTSKRSLPPSFLNGKCPKSSTERGDDTSVYGNAGTYRVLTSPMVPEKFYNSWQLSQKNLGIGEDRHSGNDERPIYREALQNLGQPNLEEDLPEGLLSVSLLKHQKIALAWMVQKEKSIHCAGGILADDQGLGKTVSMIALIQKQMPQQLKFTHDNSNYIKPEALNLDEDDDAVNEGHRTSLQNGEYTGKSELLSNTPNFQSQNDVANEGEKNLQNGERSRKSEPVSSASNRASQNFRPAAGTLVVCPASVLQQWARELDEKVAAGAKLSVIVYHGGSRTRNPSDLAKYDVVVTTYSIVTNEVPKQTVVDDDEDEQKKRDKYGLTSDFSSNKKRKQTSNSRKKSKKKAKGLKDSSFDMGFGPLARVRWFRVILDEAQTIKNHRTQVARACCGLRAKRRWCLSGTPMQNAIDDLYSYFRFLKYDPYAAYSSFCAQIKTPISRNASQGYKKLQAVLRAVLLRRMKDTLIDGEPILNLPSKTIRLERVEFSKEERDFYMKLEADSRQQFKMYAAAGTVKQNYANILLMLLRLRQACDHPLLVKGSNSDTVGKYSSEIARQLPREMLINLLSLLEGSLAICGVCNDPPEDAVVTMCGHVFCYQCISERLTGDDNLCPAPGCSDVLGTDSVFSKSTLRSCVSDDSANEASTSSAYEEESAITQSSYVSAKIRATIGILESISYSNYDNFPGEFIEPDCSSVRIRSYTSCSSNLSISDTGHTFVQHKSNSDLPAKAIIFSQWTSMLDLLELSLNQSLIQYRRLDGAMTLMSRDKAVKDFNNDPEVTVMLMSLKAGSLGLNMVAACHVILLDLWWNPTTEDQAIDRAHRIGQTRPVVVSRLTIKDSVEDRILALQEEKRKMVASAFGEQSGSHASRLTVEDLRYLFMVDFEDD